MKLYPGWKGNLFVFGTFILMILLNFFWQVQKTNKSFREHSLEHSKVLGAVVELIIRNSLMSRTGFETIVGSYLKNSARFIAYLDQIDSFSESELTAFAGKSGLAGIKISPNNQSDQITGPKGWLSSFSFPEQNGLTFLSDQHLYVYALPYSEEGFSSHQGCIIVGMSSEQTEEINEKISVEALLTVLNQMKGIEFVRLKKAGEGQDTSLPVGTSLVEINGKPVSETRIDIGDRELIVGLEADYFLTRLQMLKKESAGFVSLLGIFGLFSSWWLYRIQQHQLEQTRTFEREMARQREQASLGRAALTITHEMRNPLNAISIGLQRLQLECKDLDDDHRGLVISMREAVKRSNSVITNLQQYARSFELTHKDIMVSDLVESIAVLYSPQCLENGIKIDLQPDKNTRIQGDIHLLGQALENIIKNAVEAQPDGGVIHISISREERTCLIHFKNPCATLKPEQSDMIMKPYFTTKTYGTGLGLAISRRIIEAHAGEIEIDMGNELFSVCVRLPFSQNTDKEQGY